MSSRRQLSNKPSDQRLSSLHPSQMKLLERCIELGKKRKLNKNQISFSRAERHIIKEAHKQLQKNDRLRSKCAIITNTIMLEQRRMHGSQEEVSSESTDSEDERMLVDLIKDVHIQN